MIENIWRDHITEEISDGFDRYVVCLRGCKQSLLMLEEIRHGIEVWGCARLFAAHTIR